MLVVADRLVQAQTSLFVFERAEVVAAKRHKKPKGGLVLTNFGFLDEKDVYFAESRSFFKILVEDCLKIGGRTLWYTILPVKIIISNIFLKGNPAFE